MEKIMKDYESLMKDSVNKKSRRKKKRKTSRSNPDTTPIARIVQAEDGTQRLVPTSSADTTSPDFQRLLGPQGSLTTALGLQSDPTLGLGSTGFQNVGQGGTGCPTGTSSCNSDPFFHFPNLKRDSGNCLYVPTFSDVPMTLNMVAYFVQSILDEINIEDFRQEINKEVNKVANDIVYGNIYFNYIPVAVLFLLIVWILVIQGVLDWKIGLYFTVLLIVIYFLAFTLLDTKTRSIVDDITSKTKGAVTNKLSEKQNNILCNLIKSYYTSLSHMVLPEAAICGTPGVTGGTGTTTFGPCDCFDTGIQINFGPTGFQQEIDLDVPYPSILINEQLRVQGNQRCLGINNEQTLLPIIDDVCPCLSGIPFPYDISKLTDQEKTNLINCIATNIPGVTGTNLDTIAEELLFKCSADPQSENLGLCSIVSGIAGCSTRS